MQKDITQKPSYYYNAPKKPLIRKHGTILCDMVETAPIVFKDVLHRFESVRQKSENPTNNDPNGRSYFHFVDVKTNAKSSPFGYDHHFGSAFAENDFVAVTGVKGFSSDTITVFLSEDLENWEETDVTFPGMKCYNTNLCKNNGKYIMLIECEDGVPFTFRFAESEDLKNWSLLPDEYIFNKDRYAGGPAIYTLDGDPYYYVLYLELCPPMFFANCIARSKDLKNWQYSLLNPVLIHNEDDKKIANPELTPEERERIARALDINNSDIELCEYKGRTIIYYSWGSQHGIEFLAEASFEGTKKEFLQGFFGDWPKFE